jgi:hypothetical protein
LTRAELGLNRRHDEAIIRKVPGGDRFAVEVTPEHQIWYVKDRINEALPKIRPSQMTLVFGTKTLEDNNTVESYGIKADSTLVLTVKAE